VDHCDPQNYEERLFRTCLVSCKQQCQSIGYKAFHDKWPELVAEPNHQLVINQDHNSDLNFAKMLYYYIHSGEMKYPWNCPGGKNNMDKNKDGDSSDYDSDDDSIGDVENSSSKKTLKWLEDGYVPPWEVMN